ncbi:MAG: carboxypeptidase regulatory-like domain-containing protein [Myxococcota bacterium]
MASDDSGYFAVEDAPEGQLTLVTRSLPHLEVTGITLAAGLSKNVDLVLDWGEQVMTGRVLGDDAAPVSGAQLSLSWSHQRGAAHSRSLRRTLSDAGGSFRFTQLGPGTHQLAVSAPGYVERRESFEVGHRLREAELRLEPAR